jgi:hypothetical protein
MPATRRPRASTALLAYHLGSSRHIAGLDGSCGQSLDETVDAASDIGGRWAASDPEVGYRFASNLPADEYRDYVMNEIFATWSRSQPERVVEILNSAVSEHERYSIIHYGITQSVRTNLERTFALVADMSNAAARSEALKH